VEESSKRARGRCHPCSGTNVTQVSALHGTPCLRPIVVKACSRTPYAEVERRIGSSRTPYTRVERRMGSSRTPYIRVERRMGSSRTPYIRVERRIGSSRTPYIRVERRIGSSRTPYTRVERRSGSSRTPYTRVERRSGSSRTPYLGRLLVLNDLAGSTWSPQTQRLDLRVSTWSLRRPAAGHSEGPPRTPPRPRSRAPTTEAPPSAEPRLRTPPRPRVSRAPPNQRSPRIGGAPPSAEPHPTEAPASAEPHSERRSAGGGWVVPPQRGHLRGGWTLGHWNLTPPGPPESSHRATVRARGHHPPSAVASQSEPATVRARGHHPPSAAASQSEPATVRARGHHPPSAATSQSEPATVRARGHHPPSAAASQSEPLRKPRNPVTAPCDSLNPRCGRERPTTTLNEQRDRRARRSR